MNYLLLILLLFETVLIYKFNGKDAVSPSLIACCAFNVSSIVLVLADGYFQYELQFITVIIIISMVLFIFLGEMFANKVRFKPLNNYANNSVIKTGVHKYEEITITKRTVIFMFIFVVVTGAIYLLDTYNYSLTIGNRTGNIFGSAEYTRFGGGYTSNTLISQSNVLSECIVYFCFFSYAHNLLVNNRRRLYYLLPLFGFVFHILANDGRTVIIKYISILCIIYFSILKQKTNRKRGNNKKIFRIGITTVLLFLLIFRILGYRTGSSSYNDLWGNLAEYISSGLIGLDKFILYGQNENRLFGQEVFKSLYSTLRGIGFKIPIYDTNDIFFTYDGGRSNIYTGLKAYIKDFTLIGAYISMFLWGYCNTVLKKRIKANGVALMNTVLLGLFYYPVAMISIAGASHVVLSMPTIYMIIYIAIISKVFMKKKYSRNNIPHMENIIKKS